MKNIDHEKLKELENGITEIEKKLRITYKKKSIENKYIRKNKTKINGDTGDMRRTEKKKAGSRESSREKDGKQMSFIF